MANISIWEYDDLWEKGYRFDSNPMDGNPNRFLFVSREIANNEFEAAEYLSIAFKFIDKNQGTSNNKQKSQVHFSKLVVIINEDTFK